ncbi:MAG TPA: hypothetical protein VF753_16850 [Terriglobales bacterium]
MMNFNEWVLFALTPLISAGIGSFFGGYLKQKGKNFATHEDIDKLVAQVSAVTTTTKQIEAKISDEVWARQKTWELKREVLFEATKRISQIDEALRNLGSYYKTAASDPQRDSAFWGQIKNDKLKEYNKASSAFSETLDLVITVCEQETISAFFSLLDIMQRTADKIVRGEIDFYEVSTTDREAKLLSVRLAVRKEFGIKGPEAPKTG